MNVFEGARRVALFFGGCIVAAGVGTVALDKPWHLGYVEIAHLGANPKWTDDCNISQDASESVPVKLESGHSGSLTLCFRASESSHGRMLVPYEEMGEDFVRMAGPYSSEVSEYKEAYARKFDPSAFADELESGYWSKRAETAKTSAQWTIGALFVGYLAVCVIGWVARGFMGIPSGRDQRPAPTPPPEL